MCHGDEEWMWPSRQSFHNICAQRRQSRSICIGYQNPSKQRNRNIQNGYQIRSSWCHHKLNMIAVLQMVSSSNTISRIKENKPELEAPEFLGERFTKQPLCEKTAKMTHCFTSGHRKVVSFEINTFIRKSR